MRSNHDYKSQSRNFRHSGLEVLTDWLVCGKVVFRVIIREADHRFCGEEAPEILAPYPWIQLSVRLVIQASGPNSQGSLKRTNMLPGHRLLTVSRSPSQYKQACVLEGFKGFPSGAHFVNIATDIVMRGCRSMSVEKLSIILKTLEDINNRSRRPLCISR